MHKKSEFTTNRRASLNNYIMILKEEINIHLLQSQIHSGGFIVPKKAVEELIRDLKTNPCVLAINKVN
jgi:hypothetical protein